MCIFAKSSTTSPANAFTALFATASYFFSSYSQVGLYFFLMPSAYSEPMRSIFPHSIDFRPTADAKLALARNLGLICLFAIHHSTFARPSVKKWMGLPTSIERPFFVFVSSVILELTMRFWLNFDGPTLWDVTNNPFLTNIAMAIGFVAFHVLFYCTFVFDHFHLLGLSQGFGMDLNKMLFGRKHEDKLMVKWPYTMVAHPMMLFFTMSIFATPIMTASHFLLSSMYAIYIVLAVIFLEEPTLEAQLGPDYRAYRESVPRFCPFLPAAKSSDTKQKST